ncbi:hypothetical protein GCM10022211_05020 [Sphingomonas humi]|uniref:Uncharacterized protein n=1 Tax=Sphingomonas humi TaxID=335630 RepID=A0ABP7RJ70_9SPHN
MVTLGYRDRVALVTLWNPAAPPALVPPIARAGASNMAKGQVKSNKETRKPKAKKEKTIAANPSTKGSPKRED